MTNPSGVVRPTVPGVLDGHNSRLDALERRSANQQSRPASVQMEMPFTLPGGLYVSESPPYRLRRSLPLTSVAVSLGTAGTASTVIEIRVNGTAVTGGTITLTSRTTFKNVTFAAPVTPQADTDLITVAITTVGSGAADIDAQVRFG